MNGNRSLIEARDRIALAVKHHDDVYREYNHVLASGVARHDDDYFMLVSDSARAVAEAIRRCRFARHDHARLQRHFAEGV